MRQVSYAVGDSGPPITGEFPNLDLTGATVTCVILNLADGSAAFTNQSATITSASAARTRVRYALPGPFPAAGDYLGWFVAVLAGTQYRSPAFVVTVTSTAHTPGSTYPFVYGDGRGGYATVEDVVALDTRRDTRQRVDADLVETLLGDCAVELDHALSGYYQVPITRQSPQAWAVLRLVHKYWTLAALYDLLAPAAGDTESYFQAAEVYREKGTQILDDIFEGTVRLADATPVGNTPAFPEGLGATVAGDVDDTVDPRHIPIFSVDSFRRGWRLE